MAVARLLPIIAIDGGGTRCRVAYGDGTSIVSVETGSANVSSDFEGAVGEILQGLASLADKVAMPCDTLCELPAFVGLAGVTGPAVAGHLRKALPLRKVRIDDDRVAAVRGALGRQDGVIAHCGTGSFNAAQFGGEVSLAGGWGPILGDEASAQWVGRMALRLTLETVDGRLTPSPLGEYLLSRYGNPARIVDFAGSAGPSMFGAHAPLVTEYAADGDVMAQKIMQRGADEIAGALRHLGWRRGQAVCLTGGIGPHYVSYLPDDLRANVTDRKNEPLSGALSLAQDFAQEIVNECS